MKVTVEDRKNRIMKISLLRHFFFFLNNFKGTETVAEKNMYEYIEKIEEGWDRL